MDRKIFLSVLAAVLVAAGIIGAIRLARDALIVHGVNQAMQDLGRKAQQKAAAADRQQREGQRTRRIAAERDLAVRTLSESQRCVDHTVIDHLPHGFRQRIGRNGKPLRCEGRLAAEPLR